MTTQETCPAFVVSAENYDRLMGRYLPTLGAAFADAAGVTSHTQLLDVGCGPGGLTSELVRRAGAPNVAAIDPSPPFVQACQKRHPGVDVRQGVARKPALRRQHVRHTLASLVVGFMNDPVRGLQEMLRVTRPGGTVSTCFWDLDRMPALAAFWKATATVDPTVRGELRRPGAAAGELAELLTQAGACNVQDSEIAANAEYADFDDLWSAYTLGVGPIGVYYGSLDARQRDAVRAECHRLLGSPAGSFTLHATAWFATGTVVTTS